MAHIFGQINTTTDLDSIYALSGSGSGNTILFAQTALRTITNSNTPTSIFTTGDGSLTLPANHLTVGKSIRILAWGVYKSSLTNFSANIDFKIGSTTVTTTGIKNFGASQTNEYWFVDIIVTCRSIGSSGTISSQGAFYHLETTDDFQRAWQMTTNLIGGIGSLAVINTTTTQVIDVVFQWITADTNSTLLTSDALLVSNVDPA